MTSNVNLHTLTHLCRNRVIHLVYKVLIASIVELSSLQGACWRDRIMVNSLWCHWIQDGEIHKLPIITLFQYSNPQDCDPQSNLLINKGPLHIRAQTYWSKNYLISRYIVFFQEHYSILLKSNFRFLHYLVIEIFHQVWSLVYAKWIFGYE